MSEKDVAETLGYILLRIQSCFPEEMRAAGPRGLAGLKAGHGEGSKPGKADQPDLSHLAFGIYPDNKGLSTVCSLFPIKLWVFSFTQLVSINLESMKS